MTKFLYYSKKATAALAIYFFCSVLFAEPLLVSEAQKLKSRGHEIINTYGGQRNPYPFYKINELGLPVNGQYGFVEDIASLPNGRRDFIRIDQGRRRQDAADAEFSTLIARLRSGGYSEYADELMGRGVSTYSLFFGESSGFKMFLAKDEAALKAAEVRPPVDADTVSILYQAKMLAEKMLADRRNPTQPIYIAPSASEIANIALQIRELAELDRFDPRPAQSFRYPNWIASTHPILRPRDLFPNDSQRVVPYPEQGQDLQGFTEKYLDITANWFDQKLKENPDRKVYLYRYQFELAVLYNTYVLPIEILLNSTAALTFNDGVRKDFTSQVARRLNLMNPIQYNSHFLNMAREAWLSDEASLQKNISLHPVQVTVILAHEDMVRRHLTISPKFAEVVRQSKLVLGLTAEQFLRDVGYPLFSVAYDLRSAYPYPWYPMGYSKITEVKFSNSSFGQNIMLGMLSLMTGMHGVFAGTEEVSSMNCIRELMATSHSF